jgi:hypothetical protein
LLILNGCTAFETNTKIRTLSDSGFVARVPETPRQREAYAALPPYKLHRGVVKGNVFYAYKDEKNGVAYIGTEAEYARYMETRRLIAAYEMTEENGGARYGQRSQWHGMARELSGVEPARLRRKLSKWLCEAGQQSGLLRAFETVVWDASRLTH